jgi:PAS domain S-box-containing protein
MSDPCIQLLLVEDNAADAALLREALDETTYGSFRMTHTRRLDEAMRRLESEPFDVILLDLGLPDSQGLQTLERIRNRTRKTPVVVLTGLANEVLGVRAVQDGAQDYLVKGETAAAMMGRAIRFAIERKRAEEAFQAAEQRLTLAVDAAQIGIWDWDQLTGKIAWSQNVKLLFGLAPDEPGDPYETFSRILHPDDSCAVQETIEQAQATGQPYTHEYRVLWPDGSVHWIEGRGRVLRNNQGQAVRLMGTVMDVTERKTAEESARLHVAELAHLARVSTMGHMASGLAHELNQPLGAILNYAGACEEQLESKTPSHEMMLKALHEVMNETRRAGTIISRLRSFVRKQQPQSVVLDLNDLVEQAIHLLGFELRHQGIRPRLRLAGESPKVFADLVQIEQVLVNLIYNALEAMGQTPAGSKALTVETTMSEDDHRVEVCIIDTGHGVSPENMESLFNPFFTTKPHGLGMGLNISRSIVESHGGRLDAAANPEGGMRFCFALPVMETEPS